MGKLTKTRFVIDVEYAGNPKEFYKLFSHKTGGWPGGKSHIKGNATIIEATSTTTKVPIQQKRTLLTERNLVRSLLISALQMAEFEMVKPKEWYQHTKLWGNKNPKIACVTSRCSRMTGDIPMFCVQMRFLWKHALTKKLIYFKLMDDTNLYIGLIRPDVISPTMLYGDHSAELRYGPGDKVINIADPQSVDQIAAIFKRTAGDSLTPVVVIDNNSPEQK